MTALDIQLKSANRDFLHFIVTGEESLQNSLLAWQHIAASCQERHTRRLLVEDYLQGDVSAVDVYEFGEQLAQLGMPRGVRIAVVCTEDKLPTNQFAETVVTNRGFEARVFISIAAAKDWLRDSPPLPKSGARKTATPADDIKP